MAGDAAATKAYGNPKLKLGERPPGQNKDDWRQGLSDPEQKLLEAIGQFLASQEEPLGPDGEFHPGRFVVSAQRNPKYCFLNQAPWVYICG